MTGGTARMAKSMRFLESKREAVARHTKGSYTNVLSQVNSFTDAYWNAID